MCALEVNSVNGGYVKEQQYYVWYYTGVSTTPSVREYLDERVELTEQNDILPEPTSWEHGEFKITPLTRSKKVITTLAGNTHITWPTRTYPYQDGHLSIEGPYAKYVRETDHFNWVVPVNTQVQDMVLQKACSKILANQLDVSTELGELRETLEFIKSPYRNTGDMLAKILAAYRKSTLQKKGWKKVRPSGLKGPDDLTLGDLRTYLGATWLETRFAFMPLIRSFAAILEEFDRKHSTVFDPDKIHVSRSSYFDEIATERIVPNQKAYYWMYFDKYGSLVVDQRTKACVFYRLTKPTTRLAELGLAWDDIPEAAWELMPLSFIVDRFLAVGDWIRSHTLPPNIELLGNTVSTRTRWSGQISYKPVLTTGRRIVSHNSSRTFYQRDDYVRQINLPTPLLPSITSLRTLKDWSHWIDHITITQALLGGKTKRY